jgi:DNA excision repair protein ERCC-3
LPESESEDEEDFAVLADDDDEDDADSDDAADCDADYDNDLAVDDGREDKEVLAEALKETKRKAPRTGKSSATVKVSAMDMLLALPADAQVQWHAMQRQAAVAASKPLRGRDARQVMRFEINALTVEEVRRIALSLEPPYPMMHEYDFRADSLSVAPLEMSLRQPELLRPYQAKSLAKMYGNGRARSGIIVLPCGAGKTLVGIAAACTMKKSVLVFCPNSTSVDQWVGQFKAFTTVESSRLIKLTAKNKQELPPPSMGCIVLTPYHMIAAGGKRAVSTQALLKSIEEREWGLALLDEVHQAVADKFSRVLRLRCHCRLGLTATLVREDDRDKELSYMVGPKLYEANWMDLTKQGFLANVQVVEVWCPMTRDFYREYLSEGVAARRTALSTMNPTKCFALHRLLQLHRARAGDKIIVFSESVYALELYAQKFKAPCITGSTPEKDRAAYIRAFRSIDSGIDMLFLTRVGDVALDVPDANVIIQIASHFGSRLQEAQRLGRILRKGRQYHAASQYNAFFYTLISTDTKEVYFSNKRRRYLVDQGYAYKVVHAVAEGGKGLAPSLEALKEGCPYMRDQTEQDRELQKILRDDVGAADVSEAKALDAMADGTGSFVDQLRQSDRFAAAGKSRASAMRSLVAAPIVSARRTIGSMHSWSMANNTQYMEYASEARLEALHAAEVEGAKARTAAMKQAVGNAGKAKQ